MFYVYGLNGLRSYERFKSALSNICTYNNSYLQSFAIWSYNLRANAQKKWSNLSKVKQSWC